MPPDDSNEVLRRKQERLGQFLTDLALYADRPPEEQRREHYAIERLLQLLCEASADIGLQLLRRHGYRMASSYREVFLALRDRLSLDAELTEQLVDACAMRNVLTHLYDTIDIDRVIEAVTPALEVYGAYAEWVQRHVQQHTQ